VNYGYDGDQFESSKQKRELAAKLQEIIDAHQPDAHNKRAYVEVDELYYGVRVRRLTHYSQEVLEQMIHEFDAAFKALQPHVSDPQRRPL
jgi:hypothetical protein